MASKGRPRTSPLKYPRDKRLTEKFPSLPEMDPAIAALAIHPSTDDQERQCSEAVWEMARQIRLHCEHRLAVPSEPYEVPVIEMAAVIAAKTQRVYRQ